MKPSDIKKLIKECITEVLKEDLSETNSDKIWADRGLKVGAQVRDIYGNFGIVKSHFVDRIHLTISWYDGKESSVEYTWITPLIKEGFDPCSNAGPNVTGDPDFYRRTNAHMRQLEEDGIHSRYAQTAGAGQFDPRTFGVNEKKFLASLGFDENYKPIPVKKIKTYQCPKCKKNNAIYKSVHEDTDIEESELQCPDCKYCG